MKKFLFVLVVGFAFGLLASKFEQWYLSSGDVTTDYIIDLKPNYCVVVDCYGVKTKVRYEDLHEFFLIDNL